MQRMVKRNKVWLIALVCFMVALLAVANRDSTKRERFSRRGVKPNGKFTRAFERDENMRCSAQIMKLNEMKVDHVLVQTLEGFTLAVMPHNDVVSKKLILKGAADAERFGRYLDAAKARRGVMGEAVCQSPPCTGDMFLDVGAGVGYWSFLAASRGMHAVAVEGGDIHIALLELSKCISPELGRRVKVVQAYVGEGSKHCAVAVRGGGGDASTHCQDEPYTQADVERLRNAFEVSGMKMTAVSLVDMKTLDEIYDGLWSAPGSTYDKTVTATKISVSGADLQVLHGGANMFSSVPTIYTNIMAGKTPAEHLAHLRSLGYTLYRSDCLTKIDEPSFLTALEQQRSQNVYAVRD